MADQTQRIRDRLGGELSFMSRVVDERLHIFIPSGKGDKLAPILDRDGAPFDFRGEYVVARKTQNEDAFWRRVLIGCGFDLHPAAEAKRPPHAFSREYFTW